MSNRTYLHRIITLLFFLLKASGLKSNKLIRSVFDYMNVDWTKVKVYLTNADLIGIVSDSVGIPEINRICDNWVSKLEEIFNTYVPRRIICDINSPPWIDSEVINLSKKKRLPENGLGGLTPRVLGLNTVDLETVSGT